MEPQAKMALSDKVETAASTANTTFATQALEAAAVTTEAVARPMRNALQAAAAVDHLTLAG
jgi:hypothetical protein